MTLYVLVLAPLRRFRPPRAAKLPPCVYSRPMSLCQEFYHYDRPGTGVPGEMIGHFTGIVDALMRWCSCVDAHWLVRFGHGDVCVPPCALEPR
jgi:hypothetical protein